MQTMPICLLCFSDEPVEDDPRYGSFYQNANRFQVGMQDALCKDPGVSEPYIRLLVGRVTCYCLGFFFVVFARDAIGANVASGQTYKLDKARNKTRHKTGSLAPPSHLCAE